MAKEKEDSSHLSNIIIGGMQEKKGIGITKIDLRNISQAVADYFIICHGTSKNQIEALVDAVIDNTRNALQQKPWHKEGFQNAEWILLDYVDVVVHIFNQEMRSFYNLEDLWADAEIERIPEER